MIGYIWGMTSFVYDTDALAYILFGLLRVLSLFFFYIPFLVVYVGVGLWVLGGTWQQKMLA